MKMIEEIKKALKMEVRPNSQGDEYLEAVVEKRDLQSLRSILIKYLGREAKEPGKDVVFPEKIQKVVDALGGLYIGQSFFYKEEGGKLFFAALWPWESNPEKVTLKSGIEKL